MVKVTVQCQNCWYPRKGLVTTNTHVKYMYQSSSTHYWKVNKTEFSTKLKSCLYMINKLQLEYVMSRCVIKPSCFFYVNIKVVYRRGVDICKNLSPLHTRMPCVKFGLVLLEKIFFSNLLLLSPTISAWPFSDPMQLCAKHG